MQPRVRQALGLRRRVLDAVCAKDAQRLRSLLRQLIAFQPSRLEIASSGIGFLLADRTIWSMIDPSSAALAGVALRRWKLQVRRSRASSVAPLQAVPVAPRPFGGVKACEFLEVVDSLESELLNLDEIPVGDIFTPDPAYRSAAQRLAFRGFTSWTQLDGCSSSDVAAVGESALERAILERAVQHATQLAAARRTTIY